MLKNSGLKSVAAEDGAKKVTFTIKGGKDAVVDGCDTVLLAIGRKPLTDINLDKAGVELTDQGYIKVDEWQQTTAEGV